MSAPENVERRDGNTDRNFRRLSQSDLIQGNRNRPAPDAQFEGNFHYQKTVFGRRSHAVRGKKLRITDQVHCGSLTDYELGDLLRIGDYCELALRTSPKLAIRKVTNPQ